MHFIPNNSAYRVKMVVLWLLSWMNEYLSFPHDVKLQVKSYNICQILGR